MLARATIAARVSRARVGRPRSRRAYRRAAASPCSPPQAEPRLAGSRAAKHRKGDLRDQGGKVQHMFAPGATWRASGQAQRLIRALGL